MHLTDSAVRQQLFLDVLDGTKVLVGAAAFCQFFNFPIAHLLRALRSSIYAAACHHKCFFDPVKLGCNKISLPQLMSCLQIFILYVLFLSSLGDPAEGPDSGSLDAASCRRANLLIWWWCLGWGFLKVFLHVTIATVTLAVFLFSF